MLFSSIPFIYYFLPCFFLCYFIVPNTWKNIVLFAFSLFFYSWGEPKYVLLMLLSIILGYIEGIMIEKAKGHNKAFWITVFACGVHLSLLFYFKYLDFFIENLNRIGFSIHFLHVLLPIGISFYTFQIISYLIDVYRKQCTAQKNFILFGTYISMFPQLIAGPIVRYVDIEKQLSVRTYSLSQTAIGIRRFMIGLAKKVILANTLGEFCSIFQSTSDPSVLYYWLYVLGFSLQIYFDFSGYSNMAIGLGKILGFQFLENFNYPFISRSITEFWRRWHMSLGSWFRDYVYIPMGGNRVPKIRWIFNILVVWMLTGLWHGAAWNFVLWGLFFVIFLVFEKCIFKNFLDKHKIISHIYVCFTIMISFLIFNSNSISDIAQSIKVMFMTTSMPLVSKEALYYLKSYGMIFIISIVASTPIMKKGTEYIQKYKMGQKILNLLEPILLILCLFLVTVFLINDSYNPFLYFRF